MRLPFLGTGGFHPSVLRHAARLLFPDLGLAFDAGSCSFRNASRLTTTKLEIFLTHSHLDHISGLTMTYLAEDLLEVEV
jgi:ribonuclease BN (tRNA processing enzyme)